MTDIERGMKIAFNEATQSLREGNYGFGAVIVKDNEIVSRAHDMEETQQDCTSHAEINAIKAASKRLGRNLSGCVIISTHEPCPMCASAIVWSGIEEIAFGYSIEESIKQGRNRIALNCRDIFERAEKNIKITPNVLYEECKILYMNSVRTEIKRLRCINDESLQVYNDESKSKRIDWFSENRNTFKFIGKDKVYSAYKLLLCRFGIDQKEAPIISHDGTQIVFHSKNFCPTLEACKILELDTRYICKKYNEESTDALIKQIDKNLSFQRNYENLRPYANYCEEKIVLIN